MAVWAIRGGTVTVQGYKDLIAAWKRLRNERYLIRRWIVKDALTKAQLRRLPISLRTILKHGKDDSIEWLKQLYRLEDPRDSV